MFLCDTSVTTKECGKRAGSIGERDEEAGVKQRCWEISVAQSNRQNEV